MVRHTYNLFADFSAQKGAVSSVEVWKIALSYLKTDTWFGPTPTQLGTQDSGLRTRDSGLGTQDLGPGTRDRPFR
jgi:hypothetical protein